MNCSVCGKELEKHTPEEKIEMAQELERNFPGFSVEECGIVCDDCFKEFKNWRRNELLGTQINRQRPNPQTK